jgi:hypothetical protein
MTPSPEAPRAVRLGRIGNGTAIVVVDRASSKLETHDLSGIVGDFYIKPTHLAGFTRAEEARGLAPIRRIRPGGLD